jgi:hypothetical protein
MTQVLHSLAFALEQTDLACWQREDMPVVEVEEIRDENGHRNGWFVLTIGDKEHPLQQHPYQSIGRIEDALPAMAEEYVKGSRVWEDIGE